MKVLAVGDIHGNSVWKKIKFGEYDKVIFLGDLVDSRKYNPKEVRENLIELVEFKKASNPNHIIFLPGNHDIQYLLGSDFRCTGFVAEMEESYRNLLCQIYDFTKPIKFLHLVDGVLYSHGGVLREFIEIAMGLNVTRVSEDLVNAYNYVLKDKIYLLDVSSPFRGGTSLAGGSPIWCDFKELVREKSPLPINQVVGHSASSGSLLNVKTSGFWNLCVDDFQTNNRVFEIVDGKFERVYDASQ